MAKRRALSLRTNSDVEEKIEEFVSNGNFSNLSGKPAWGESTMVWVDLDRILLPEFQLRLYFDRAKIEQIKATIKSSGIKEPLLLRPHKYREGYFELIAGSQRRLSAEELGYSPVPARVDEVDDYTALKISIVENDARSDINLYERTRGVVRLLEVALNRQTDEVCQIMISLFNAENRGIENNDIINSDEYRFIASVFEEMGLNWKSFVANQLPLLKLPIDIVEVLERGAIEYTKALKIARVKEVSIRKKVLKIAVEQKLSIKQIQELIDQYSNQNPKNDETALRDRVRTVLNKVTSPKFLKDHKVRKKVENIAKQLEALLAETESDSLR
jgi:ParB family transcriptional regulator, chromosome partitioning protein